jgi:hypothetical protein
VSEIEYLDVWTAALAHQREHEVNRLTPDMLTAGADVRKLLVPKPNRLCTACAIEHQSDQGFFDDVHHYAWAVPTESALAEIRAYSPRGIVEIGAGGGYWAMLLRERGVDVVAYDPDPAGPNTWHDGRCWSAVLAGDHTAVVEHPERTLMLCWPEQHAKWSAEAVELYAGATVVYVGEDADGITGCARMHDLLESKFTEVSAVALPQWVGTFDQLSVHVRTRWE